MAPRLAPALVALVLLVHTAQPTAHDIPSSVVVQAFARPEGTRLTMLLRVPLVSMRDFNFPAHPGLLDGPMLDVGKVAPMLKPAAALWLVPAMPMFEESAPLPPPEVIATRISLPSDRSFESFDQALAHFSAPPLPDSTEVATSAALFDLKLEYRIKSDRVPFSINPLFARLGLRVLTSFRFEPPGQPERAFQFVGDPGLIRLDPSWWEAARTFVGFGFSHILDGVDHLLFLFCLVLPLRRFWQLFGVVTSFTVAHSITLFCAASGLAPSALWFPPFIEVMIAISIVYMAVENIVVAARTWSGPFRRASDEGPAGPAVGARAFHNRWMIAFAFGLVHGFGFSFALQQTLQFAGRHLVASLFAFNIGVELGQLLVLLIALPLLAMTFRYVVEERIGVIIASALVLHTAWHWMTERASALGQYDLALTSPSTLAILLRVLMVAIAVIGAGWILKTRR
ncbi:MAG TPA: HupE/UreJ family protein [Vicinamibacterales bacterium]|nr:HupE/UreJ family protein [Vicinamibacterales bacterium]